jgi:hypothetical protein
VWLPPQAPKWEQPHSLAGEGAGGPNSDDWTEDRHSGILYSNPFALGTVLGKGGPVTQFFSMSISAHCKEISIYVFPEKELRGLSPNFHIHVSVSDPYIPTIGPPIFLQQNRLTDQGYI